MRKARVATRLQSVNFIGTSRFCDRSTGHGAFYDANALNLDRVNVSPTLERVDYFILRADNFKSSTFSFLSHFNYFLGSAHKNYYVLDRKNTLFSFFLYFLPVRVFERGECTNSCTWTFCSLARRKTRFIWVKLNATSRSVSNGRMLIVIAVIRFNQLPV